MGIEYFVRKLRSALHNSDSLIRQRWGNFHLLSTALKHKHATNPRIANLIGILESGLAHAIANAEKSRETDLSKLMTVLDAIEFHLEKFQVEHDTCDGSRSWRGSQPNSV